MTTPSDKVAIYISREARDYYASYVPSSLVPPMASEVWAACAESKAGEQTYDVTVKGLRFSDLLHQSKIADRAGDMGKVLDVQYADYQFATACRAKLAEIEGRK